VTYDLDDDDSGYGQRAEDEYGDTHDAGYYGDDTPSYMDDYDIDDGDDYDSYDEDNVYDHYWDDWDDDDVRDDDTSYYYGGGRSRPRHPGSASNDVMLSVIALVTALACGPVGLVIGLIVLNRKPQPGSAEHVCAWIAVALGAFSFLFCLGCCGFNFLGSFLGAGTG
jgi:hypothetical protein